MRLTAERLFPPPMLPPDLSAPPRRPTHHDARIHRARRLGRYLLPASRTEGDSVSLAQRRRSSTPVDRGELLGTIAGAVLVVPLLGGTAYLAWLLVRVVL